MIPDLDIYLSRQHSEDAASKASSAVAARRRAQRQRQWGGAKTPGTPDDRYPDSAYQGFPCVRAS